MKTVVLLSRLTALGVVAATAGLALDALALPLFAATAGAWVLLLAASDYTRKPGGYAAVRRTTANARSAEVMPLAA